jgi:hypothetical protein
MLRAMAVEVTVKTVGPTPTAVVMAAATWADFPAMWGPTRRAEISTCRVFWSLLAP